MDEDPPAFTLQPCDYPLTIELLDETGELVHFQRVDGPGVLTIPGRAHLGGVGKISVRLTTPHGVVAA